MSSAVAYTKRLIEVDLPIRRIGELVARTEKRFPTPRGHLATMHTWWARRPLGVCRAVLLATLWPDPADSSCPDSFVDAVARARTEWHALLIKDRELAALCSDDSWRTAVDSSKKSPGPSAPAPEVLRSFLLTFLGDSASWAAGRNRHFVEFARRLTACAHEALGGAPGDPQVVADPFAGGGAIPLEALRAGVDVVASDLNPVAVLLNKVALQDIPKYGVTLSAEIERASGQISSEVIARLREYFPAPGGDVAVAYLWARTAVCEGPGCGVRYPLLRSLWLGRSKGFRCAVQLNRDGDQYKPAVLVNPSDNAVGSGTVKRSSGTCPSCGYTTPAQNIRDQFKDRRGGTADALLVGVAHKLASGQIGIRAPSSEDLVGVDRARAAFEDLSTGMTPEGDSLFPTEPFPYLRSIFNIKLLGVEQWVDLFSARQAIVVHEYCQAIRQFHDSAIEAGRDADLAKAVSTCLALALDKVADFNASLCMWRPGTLDVGHVFGRQALGIVWDFVESNPLSGHYVDWNRACGHVRKVIDEIAATVTKSATVIRASATVQVMPEDSVDVYFTDPPYYDMVPYADLSDFFYLWLKRSIGRLEPDLFADRTTPKRGEIVQLAERNPEYAFKTKSYYEDGMRSAFAVARSSLKPGGVAVIVFAHKETATWETQLTALVDAGWTVVGSWPVDTEMGSRLRAQNSAVLTSSIHLVCRPREDSSGALRVDDVGDWREVLEELPRRIHAWMPRLVEEGIVGADAIFSCLGPALEVFSRHSRVEKANGDAVLLKEYLEHVWAAVAREALSTILQDGDSGSLEPDARLTVIWLWTLSAGNSAVDEDEEGDADDASDGDDGRSKATSGYVLEFDAARKIAQGLGANLEALGSVVAVKGDEARLLPVAERSRHLFGRDENVTSAKRPAKRKQMALFEEIEEAAATQGWGDVGAPAAGSTTLDRVHQAMVLFASGRGEALKRFLVEEGVGRQASFWRLSQALAALYPVGSDERRWVEGVLARKKGLGFG